MLTTLIADLFGRNMPKLSAINKKDKLYLMSIAMYSASIQFATTVKQRTKCERASLCTFLKFKETVFLEGENQYH